MVPEKTDAREKLCKELQLFAEKHPEQQITADEMQTFIRNTPECFERRCRAGHMTGSAWLVSPDGHKVLLTLHHKLGRWLQPGGHADGHGNLLSVSLREAEEESGITGIHPISAEIFDIDIHSIPASADKDEPEHLHYDVRYLLQAPHEQFIVSPESDMLAWYSMEDITTHSAMFDGSVLRMAVRYFQNAL